MTLLVFVLAALTTIVLQKRQLFSSPNKCYSATKLHVIKKCDIHIPNQIFLKIAWVYIQRASRVIPRG